MGINPEAVKKKEVIVMASGCFDPLHAGHIFYFKQAKKLGTKLIVVLDGDGYILGKKGKVFMPSESRKAIIQELKCVDEVVALTGEKTDVSEAILEIKPDIFAVGDVASRAKLSDSEAKACEEVGCKVIFGLGGRDRMSSSELLRRWTSNQ